MFLCVVCIPFEMIYIIEGSRTRTVLVLELVPVRTTSPSQPLQELLHSQQRVFSQIFFSLFPPFLFSLSSFPFLPLSLSFPFLSFSSFRKTANDTKRKKARNSNCIRWANKINGFLGISSSSRRKRERERRSG